MARAELYGRIAEGYFALGDETSMLSLASTALALSRSVGATEESIRSRLPLAPLLAAAGDDTQALAALESALEFAAATQDPRLRADLLPRIVESALRSDEPARPVLRRAVDEVYIIEDPEQRAEALIRIGELYQTGGATLSVTGLIQQAIPATRSARSPWTRADLFTRLSLLAGSTNEQRLAGRLRENAVADVEHAVAPQTDEESELLVRVIERLALMGETDTARRFVERLESPYYRARGLIAIGESLDTPAARLVQLDAARELLVLVEPTPLAVDIHLRLATAYLSSSPPATTQAVPQLQAAADLIVSERSIYSRIEPAARLAELLVRVDGLQAIRELLLVAPDAYIRGAVAERAAGELIAEGRLGLADDFLTVALVASDEATYLADGLRQGIVSGFSQTGSIRLAIRTIERMDDELLRARAVAELAVNAEPAGLVTPIYRADLASVLSGR